MTSKFNLMKSFVFGLQCFNAPLSQQLIRYIKISSIFSVLFENIPQLIVQLLVKIKTNANFDGTVTTVIILNLYLFIFGCRKKKTILNNNSENVQTHK